MTAPQTKLKITGIGILSRFHIMHYRNKDVGIDIRGIPERDRPVDLKTGIEITPNLRIRFANKEDSDILAPFNPSLNSIIHCSLNQYVLESTFEVEDNPSSFSNSSRLETESRLDHPLQIAGLLQYCAASCYLEQIRHQNRPKQVC